jgi:hypothetical protein
VLGCPTVGVDDDLAPREPGVALGTAGDEATGGVHQYLGGALIEELLRYDGVDDALDDVVPNVVLRPVAVLG